MQARTAFAASMPSAGTMTVRFANARTMDRSSVEWWVAPAEPNEVPPCVAITLTLRFW